MKSKINFISKPSRLRPFKDENYFLGSLAEGLACRTYKPIFMSLIPNNIMLKLPWNSSSSRLPTIYPVVNGYLALGALDYLIY